MPSGVTQVAESLPIVAAAAARHGVLVAWSDDQS